MAAAEDMEHMVEEGHMVRVGMALPPLAEPLLEPLPLVQPVPFPRGHGSHDHQYTSCDQTSLSTSPIMLFKGKRTPHIPNGVSIDPLIHRSRSSQAISIEVDGCRRMFRSPSSLRCLSRSGSREIRRTHETKRSEQRRRTRRGGVGERRGRDTQRQWYGSPTVDA